MPATEKAPATEEEPAPAGAASVAEQPPAPGREERSRRAAIAPRGRATCDSQGRALASLGQLEERAPSFAPAAAVAEGGILAALPALLQAGLLGHLGALSVGKGFYGLHSTLLVPAFLLPARVRNPERLGAEAPGEWGALPGLDRCPCPRTLRRKMHRLGEQPEALQAWRSGLAGDWAADDPAAAATLFLDGHVQVYHGRGNLLKHYVPRLRLALPASVSYWVAALGGAPLPCLHCQADPGMVRALADLAWSLLARGLLPAGSDPPEGEPPPPRLTLVFDRDGWSPELFRQLRRQGVAAVTWIKDKREQRWPEADFKAAASPSGPSPPGGGVKARGIRFRIDRRQPPAGDRRASPCNAPARRARAGASRPR